MSFMDEYNALKKKRLPGIGPSSVSTVGSPDKQTDKSLTISDFMDEYNKLKEQMLPSKNGNSSAGDIAPVSNPTYFKAGAFSDGYQAWDVTKTILGTTGDAGLDLVKGAGNLAEGIAKSIGYTIADAADLIGNLSGDEYSEYFDFADEVRGELQRNIISNW